MGHAGCGGTLEIKNLSGDDAKFYGYDPGPEFLVCNYKSDVVKNGETIKFEISCWKDSKKSLEDKFSNICKVQGYSHRRKKYSKVFKLQYRKGVLVFNEDLTIVYEDEQGK